MKDKKNLNRLSVSLFFFINGYINANWVARIPELQEFYNVSNSELGTLLLISSFGAIIAMPLASILFQFLGSKKITQITGILICFGLPLITFTNILLIISVVFFLFGFIAGSMDVSMNGQAVYVEKKFKKHIMSSFHAIFSFGTVLGASTGTLFTKLDISLFIHAIIISIFCLLVIIYACFNLLDDEKIVLAEHEKEKKRGIMLPSKAILPLGIIAFCGMSAEASMGDWSALYINKVLLEDKVFSGLGFTFFTISMTIGRVFGDYLINKFGKNKFLVYESTIATIGLIISLTILNKWIVLFGFTLVGLGLSNIVPIIYSAAGNTKGVPPSVGIAMATTIGYAGFFVCPPIIGYLGDIFSLRIGLLFTLSLLFILLIIVFFRNKINSNK